MALGKGLRKNISFIKRFEKKQKKKKEENANFTKK